MQTLIEQLNTLQTMPPDEINGFNCFKIRTEELKSFSEIIAEFAETSLSILQSFSPQNEILALDDQSFQPCVTIGQCLAETHPNEERFHILLREAIVFFTATMHKAIDKSGYSGIDFLCLQLFFSQVCAKIEQGYLEKSHSMLVARRHFAKVSNFPQDLSYSYVSTIVKKLGHIPMAEINFSKKIMYVNDNMKSLFSNHEFSSTELIPECLFEDPSLLRFADKNSPEPFFRDLSLNKRSFQQLILVLPQNRVFITFIIETPESHNTDTPGTESGLFHQDQQSEHLNKIKESFLANMSHELRTPLHEIIGFADLLFEQFDGDLNDSQIEYVQMIQRGGERLLELINYLLKIGGTVTPQGSSALLPVDILISEITNRLDKEIKKKKISFNVSVESDLMVYKGDKDRILIVINEILSYILKHVRTEGKMSVIFSRHNKWNEIKIIVADAAFVDFSEEMLLSHATFFLDLMQGHLKSDVTEDLDRVFKIRLPL